MVSSNVCGTTPAAASWVAALAICVSPSPPVPLTLPLMSYNLAALYTAFCRPVRLVDEVPMWTASFWLELTAVKGAIAVAAATVETSLRYTKLSGLELLGPKFSTTGVTV